MTNLLKINKSEEGSTLKFSSENLPECWTDDQRMNALFSPLRSRSTNPQDWHSKYVFWTNLIINLLKHNMQCNFSILELNQVLKRNGCTPHCLKSVVEELLRTNEIIPEDQFHQEQNDSWISWTVSTLLKKPLIWSYSTIKNYMVGQDINIETQFVHLQLVKSLSDLILSTVESKKENKLFTISEIHRNCIEKSGNKNINECSIRLAVIWLKHTKRATFSKNLQSEVLVKLSIVQVQEVSEAEQVLYTLTRKESQIMEEILSMETEKVTLIKQSKECLSKNLRLSAKTHLRKKMELEKTIEKKSQILFKLQNLISSIHDTQSNSSILTAYKAASDVLKKMGKDGANEDNAKDIMDNLIDALEDTNDLKNIISEPIQSDDSDLEAELEDLLNSSDDLIEMPDIPTELNTTKPEEIDSQVSSLQKRLDSLKMKDLSQPQPI